MAIGSDAARLALAGAREYVVRAARTDTRAAQIVQLIDRALEELAPKPAAPAAPEERWDFPEPKLSMPEE